MFFLATRQMTVQKHKACVVVVEPYWRWALVGRDTPCTCFYLNRLYESDLVRQVLTNEKQNGAPVHDLPDRAYELFAWHSGLESLFENGLPVLCAHFIVFTWNWAKKTQINHLLQSNHEQINLDTFALLWFFLFLFRLFLVWQDKLSYLKRVERGRWNTAKVPSNHPNA